MQTTSLASSSSRNKLSRAARRKSLSSGDLSRYSPLSLYENPPNTELSIEDFEMYALNRLQVLRQLEQLKLRGLKGADFQRKMDAALMEHLPMRSTNPVYSTEDMKRDELSHFILRIAYCRTESLRRWFITMEGK